MPSTGIRGLDHQAQQLGRLVQRLHVTGDSPGVVDRPGEHRQAVGQLIELSSRHDGSSCSLRPTSAAR